MREEDLERFHAFGIRNPTIEVTAESAVQKIKTIYQHSVKNLQDAFAKFAQDGLPPGPIDAYYPYVGIYVKPEDLNLDARIAYGALHDPGLFGTTLTHPELFGDYYTTQLGILQNNHKVNLIVGVSPRPIPLPFVVDSAEGQLTPDKADEIRYRFPMPDLSQTDDSIANGTQKIPAGMPSPLALFTAERVDYSLHRLAHYTGTLPDYFQRFVLLTNYQRYVDHFIAHSMAQIQEGEEYDRFVAPNNQIFYNKKLNDGTDHGNAPDHLPQMPAYHLTRPDGRGITMINIGVGPSNARTITDHVAVLRPHCWLMLGHCAGLRRSQRLGDYILAHGYVREDHVLDQEVPPFVPVPPIAEVQVALQDAVAKITGQHGLDLKTRMRTGTVMTTDNRNWELRYDELFMRLNQSRAIAVDMESATIAANGLRFRVPYGTLLCVSDKPLHGELKLRGMANTFYRERIDQHLQIGLEAMRTLREQGPDRLHSRKLRSFDEPAFR